MCSIPRGKAFRFGQTLWGIAARVACPQAYRCCLVNLAIQLTCKLCLSPGPYTGGALYFTWMYKTADRANPASRWRSPRFRDHRCSASILVLCLLMTILLSAQSPVLQVQKSFHNPTLTGVLRVCSMGEVGGSESGIFRSIQPSATGRSPLSHCLCCQDQAALANLDIPGCLQRNAEQAQTDNVRTV